MHELTKHSLAIAQCPLCSTPAHPPADPRRTVNAPRGYTARLPADTPVVMVALSTPAAQAQAPTNMSSRQRPRTRGRPAPFGGAGSSQVVHGYQGPRLGSNVHVVITASWTVLNMQGQQSRKP
jgi:hypothetical protein